MPRKISSRSSSLSAAKALRRGAGPIPPWSTAIRSTPVLFFLSSARAIAAALCPFLHRSHSSAFCAADFRTTLPRFTPEARKTNQGLIDLLERIAQRKKATPAQIAIAWLLAQKSWIVPIPGTTKLLRLEENVGAAGVDLTSDDLRQIESAAAKITVQGARYPEKLKQMTGR